MVLTLLAYLMIICFMIVIMKKWLSPFISLVLVPIIFALVTVIFHVAKYSPVAEGMDPTNNLGKMVMNGMTSVTSTGLMLIFAIFYFSIMLDAGLFEPITRKMIHLSKGDPMKILVATAIVSAAVSLNGDGTTTTLIVTAAFLPIYRKLGMKIMNLAVLLILQNTIMNLLPWGGPTARAMAVMNVGADILTYLLPGMIISLVYVVVVVSRSMGKKERARLGVTQMTNEEIENLLRVDDEAVLKLQRPKLFIFNGILTIILIAWLVGSSFVDKMPAVFGFLDVPSPFLFLVGVVIALMVNYPNLKEQSSRITEHGGDVLQVVILIFAAGVFLGLFSGTGMANALSESLINIIPKSAGGFWGLIVTLISAPGTFFLSNDGFYFGVMPVLADAGHAFGFTNMQMALASLMGQAFHLLSPLVAFIYLLLRITGLDMGEWQKESFKWAIPIFVIFVVSIILLGHMPVYIPQ